ncbi:hypothetical protein [Methylobacter luteus]|uniref:hypothetical protein n=1 Tax=Methylobacter luteus TaxID=415 RepID=UPI00047FC97C|nr:hypothetical protein [Methylobacter luteus]
MKKYVKMLPLAAIFFTLSANADVQLKDKSEILGKWNLYAEAIKLNGEKKAITVEWDFKDDGTLETTATDSVGRTSEFKANLKYAVEDGVLKKQLTPGREKYESCKVVEKDNSKMVLKCTYLFFFLTKK